MVLGIFSLWNGRLWAERLLWNPCTYLLIYRFIRPLCAWVHSLNYGTRARTLQLRSCIINWTRFLTRVMVLIIHQSIVCKGSVFMSTYQWSVSLWQSVYRIINATWMLLSNNAWILNTDVKSALRKIIGNSSLNSKIRICIYCRRCHVVTRIDWVLKLACQIMHIQIYSKVFILSKRNLRFLNFRSQNVGLAAEIGLKS